MVCVHEFSSYVTYLKAVIRQNSEIWGFQARLARAAGCQPSYLSQVLSEKVHLTPDHVAGIAAFLELTEAETDFLLLLVQQSRAATKKLRDLTEKRIQKLKTAQRKLSQRLEVDRPEKNVEQSPYYSSWLWSAIHVATASPQYGTVEALAERFGIGRERALRTLEELQRLGLVRQSQGRWNYAGASFHLPSRSLWSELNHANWRQRAILDLQKEGCDTESVHFTSVFGLAKEDVSKIREQVMRMIEELRGNVAKSGSDEVHCLLVDFFSP